MGGPQQTAFSKSDLARAESYKARDYPKDVDPKIESLMRDMISGFADKWTIVILDTLSGRRHAALLRDRPPCPQHQPEDADADIEAHGTRRPGHPHALRVGAAQGGVQALTAGSDAGCCVLQCSGIWAVENYDAVEGARSAFDQGDR